MVYNDDLMRERILKLIHKEDISQREFANRIGRKPVAVKAGIDKPLASHWGRRTCGMILLNDGYPIEVVAKVLGHTDIRTTQKAYAKILTSTVIDKFKEIEGRKG